MQRYLMCPFIKNMGWVEVYEHDLDFLFDVV